VFVAVIDGVIATPMLVLVMMVAGSTEIMGEYVNGRLATTLGWLTVAIMGASSVALFATGGINL
jgi:Mn2+/Fe2+ NRAMP family transporter